MIAEDMEEYRQRFLKRNYRGLNSGMYNMDLPELYAELRSIDIYAGAIDHYYFAEKTSNKLQLLLLNNGTKPLENVEVLLEFDFCEGLNVEEKIPPYISWESVKSIVPSIDTRGHEHYPLIKNENRMIRVKSKLGMLKHRQSHNLFLEALRVWAMEELSGSTFDISIMIFADNLPEPIKQRILVSID